MKYIVTLAPVDRGQRWESYGPFDSQTEAGNAAKANYRAGDKRRWVVIPLTAGYMLEQMGGVI